MRSCVAALCSFIVADASVFSMTPDRDAQVWVIFDADMPSHHLYEVGNGTMEQLSALAETYDKAGVSLEVGVSWVSAVYPKTCNYYTPGFYSDPATYNDHIDSMIRDHPMSDTALETTHITLNAIYLGANFTFWNLDDSTRRVVVLYTDRVEPFGSADAIGPCAVNNVISQEAFTEVLESRRTALLYSIISTDARAIQKEGNTRFRSEAGLSDFFVDEYGETGYEFDTIEYHLRRLVDPRWIATTSTTTLPPTSAPTIDEIIAGCQSQMTSTLDEWLEDCKEKCTFYATSPGTAWCGIPKTVEELTSCVMKYNKDHCELMA